MSSVTKFPAPAQTPLPGDPRMIRVYRESDWQEISRCHGATADGRCTHPIEDGTVPCAGCVLVLPEAIRGSVQWHIPAGYRGCFVGSYTAYCTSE